MTMLLERDTIEPQITEHISDHRDVDACEKLWHAVIEQALIDLRYLHRFEERASKRHQVEKMRRIPIVDSFLPNSQVSTKPGQLQLI